MLGSRLHEREHGRYLRAHAWIAVDRTFSMHGLGVVLHRSHPQSAWRTFHIETLAVVPHGETQPSFWRQAQANGDLAGLGVFDDVGHGLLGDTIRSQPHLLREQVMVGFFFLRELFIQLDLNRQSRSKLIAKGLKGRDETLARGLMGGVDGTESRLASRSSRSDHQSRR